MRFLSKKMAGKSARKGFLRARDGITTIEFAVIVPTMLMLMMGVIEFAMIMFVNVAMEAATTTTARLGSTGYTAAGSSQSQQIIANIMSQTAGLLNPSQITITAYSYTDLNQIPATAPTTPSQDFGTAEKIVVYTVSYPWPVTTPIIKAIVGNTYTIKTRTVVQNEPYGT